MPGFGRVTMIADPKDVKHSEANCRKKVASGYLTLFNIAMGFIPHQWRFLAGKIIYFYGPFSMAMLNNQMVLAVLGLTVGAN